MKSYEYGPLIIRGPAGYGKSVLAEALQYNSAILLGHQLPTIISIDPHSTLNTNIVLRSLAPNMPEDRVALLELGDTDHPPALPLFPKPSSTTTDAFISTTVAVLKAALADTLSANMMRLDDVLYALVTTLAYYPHASLWDIYRLIYAPHERRKILSYLPGHEFVTHAFWQRFGALSDAGREQLVSPVLSRINKLIRNNA